MKERIEEQIKKIKESPGVYLFKNKKKEVLYVGKANNLKRRVKSYLNSKDIKSKTIIEKAHYIETQKTDTIIEALIKEAELIKKYSPPFNIKENDNRSFLYVVITKEEYPRVLLRRSREIELEKLRSVFGPFVFSSEVKEALKIIRKIFPYSIHPSNIKRKERGCLDYQIGICPGTCIGEVTKREYLKNIKNIEMFLQGKKKRIISSLKREMENLSKKTEYEKAKEIKRKINALKFIEETALLKKREKSHAKERRIEGYDISNICGSFAVGVMVVFNNSNPLKKEYRVFKIKGKKEPDDTGMLKEVIERRFNNDWEKPLLIVVDGGKGQIFAVNKILKKKKIDISVVGVAKGRERKKEEIIGDVPKNISKEIIIRVQREAHRFAIKNHRRVRDKNFL